MALRYHHKAAALIVALFMAPIFSPLTWVCREGRPCAYDCHHGLASPITRADAASAPIHHACCPSSSDLPHDGPTIGVGMSCKASATGRIAVVASANDAPIQPTALPAHPDLIAPEAQSVRTVIEDDAGPPGRLHADPSAPRAPPFSL